MKNFKNQNGITLVALVVTIIVLLILAGVSLSLVAGENGILGRATGAVDKNEIATAKEQVQLLLADKMEGYYEARYVDGKEFTDVLSYILKNENAEGDEANQSLKTMNDIYTVKIGTDKSISVEGGSLKTDSLKGTIATDGKITWNTTTGGESEGS